MNGHNDKRSVTVVVCEVPVSANVLRRKYRHFSAYGKYRDGWKRTLWGLISGPDRAWLESEARLGRKFALDAVMLHNRLYDEDNAVAAMKPILDSLVSLKYLAGDDPEHLTLKVSQTKIRAKELWLTLRASS